MTMMHPGLPLVWIAFITFAMLALCIRFTIKPAHSSQKQTKHQTSTISLTKIPLLKHIVTYMTTRVWPLITLKILFALFFLLIILAGLFGTPIPEKNIATVFTWNLWWAGIIISVFFVGSAWCAVCPWDSLATWLVRRKLWGRAHPNNSLNLKVPRWLRGLWPATVMLIALTWLELGVGVTTNPYLTAVLGIVMIVLATVSLSIFEDKAFCRYFCPVGRTIGCYSQLAPIELRPIDPNICASCTTLECYHGTETVEPCPTHLVMGKLTQNTYCLSCGNCSQSCPDNNVGWHLRSHGKEAIEDARPHKDEAWFMIILLGLTALHGLTMLSHFEDWMSKLGTWLNDSGQLLGSFTLLLCIGMVLVAMIYVSFVYLTKEVTKKGSQSENNFQSIFIEFSFVAVPLAFAYHMAHNLNHLIREGSGFIALISNPFGVDVLPLTMMEKHMQHFDQLIPQSGLYAIQTGLIIFGFWISLKIIHHRGLKLLKTKKIGLLPMLGFAIVITALHTWLLSQPMIMRM